MVNKLWSKSLPEGDLWIPRCIQYLIDLYCFESSQFKVIEDITPDNCAEFWKIILRQFQCYNIPIWHLDGIDEALQCYFTYAYEFDYCTYPIYPEGDRRNLAIYIGNHLQLTGNPMVFPEDVPKLIEYLDTPSGRVDEASRTLKQYLAQFDTIARSEEDSRRWVALKKERLDALKKPYVTMPVRPMSIELDMCYKKPKEYIQSLIDYYCFESVQFKVVEDITLNNCDGFWKILLKQFQYYNLTRFDLDKFGDMLGIYFRAAYPDELPDPDYPMYPESYLRNSKTYIYHYFKMSCKLVIFPEDVPKLIEYLDAPNDKYDETKRTLEQYLAQFDHIARSKELGRRRIAIKNERIEAIETKDGGKRDYIPIKPMSIDLDMCYKT